MAEPIEVVEEVKVEAPVEEVVVDKEVEVEAVEKEVEAAPDVEVSEDEQLAMDAGWKPKDQWEGDAKKWVPADEFNRRGELFGKIDNVTRDLKETKKALRMLQEHHGKVKQSEYARAVATLNQQKKDALVAGDADAVIAADDRIMDLKASRNAEDQAARTPQSPDPRFVSWVEKNSWYAQDTEMRELADDIGIAHAKTHPDKDPAEVLVYVTQRVKRAYPDKFTNPNRSRPTAVAGKEVQGAGKVTESNFKLTSVEEEIMKTFVRDGVMTRDQYIADIKSLRGS
jgi:hypothetical protein